MKIGKWLGVFFGVQITLFSFSQEKEGYYLFPIKPGQRNYLSGTMGEMRGTHFHGGIDIRTEGRIGLPVHAAADGHVVRIKVQLGGYGHSLYILHPNGTTTIYAHLDKFSAPLEAYLVQQQYARKTYPLQLYPESQRFSVKKGEVIAYSGNSGGSGGPHLHFEIRDKNQQVLDPLSFGFEEVLDRTSPYLRKVAFQTLEQDARINGAFGRRAYNVIKQNGLYTIAEPIHLKGCIGMEILYHDRHEGSTGRNGIPQVVLAVDNDTVYHEQKAILSYSKMRNIIPHMNYPHYSVGKEKFNKLWMDDGNELNFYLKTNSGIDFKGVPTVIRLALTDIHGNASEFKITPTSEQITKPPSINSFEVVRNQLHFVLPRSDNQARIYVNDTDSLLNPYLVSDQNYYLWDLRDGLPDSMFSAGVTLEPNFLSSIPSGQEYTIHNKDFSMAFQPNTLFDTLYLKFKKNLTVDSLEIFSFENLHEPFRNHTSLTLRPEFDYNTDHRVYIKVGKRFYYVGGKWEDDKISFRTRDLSHFVLLDDTVPPTVQPRTVNSRRISLTISDDLSGIRSYEATLNEDWLLMKYDKKNKHLEAQGKSPNSFYTGKFILKLYDNHGNLATYKKTIP